MIEDSYESRKEQIEKEFLRDMRRVLKTEGIGFNAAQNTDRLYGILLSSACEGEKSFEVSNWSEIELAERVAANPALARRNPHLGRNRPASDPNPQTATTVRPEPESPAEPQARVNARPHNPKTDYKSMLVQQCELAGLKMEPEFKFLPERRFKADWQVQYGMWEGERPKKLTYFVKSMVLVEYDGGIFSTGKRGHSSVSGIRRDMEKSNLAQIAGFTIIRVAADHVVSGQALTWIMDALRREIICAKCGLRQSVPPTDHGF